MARVTIEDCVEKIPNRYELVTLAARRAKDIAAGAPLTLSRDNDKDAVVSLREIAEGTIDIDQIREEVIQNFMKRQAVERFASTGGEVMAEGDPQKQEIEQAFVEDQSQIAQETDEQALQDSGMSFAGDDVQVDD